MLPLQTSPRRLLAALLIAFAVAAVIAGGLRLRRQAWDASASAHFLPDIKNAHRWGRAANRVGYLNLYRNRVDRQKRKANLQLDYPPLRLLIMERWGGWTRKNFPKARKWEPSYAFNAPLLRLNNAFELIAACAAFFLVALWTRRAAGDRAPPEGPGYRPWVLGGDLKPALAGAGAALLVWFNPALIWVAHCWPQWDAWGAAVYLVAALFASLGLWLPVGLAIGVGALLKGQVLIVAAFFVLWPLFARNFGGAARVVLGLLLGLVLGGTPWFLGTFPKNRWVFHPPAAFWVAGVLLAATVGVALWKRRNPDLRPAPWLAGAAILALVLCVPLFDADLSWVKVGFLFGTGHFPVLRMGRTPNLPALLEIWVPALEGQAPPLLRSALWLVYITGLVTVARWTARLAEQPHPRILAAFAAPWLLSVALLPQMHERYLVYGAVATAMAAVALRGFVLLHLVLTAVAVLAMVPIRLVPDLVRNGADLHPVCMILVLLAAAICFAVAAGRRPSGAHAMKSLLLVLAVMATLPAAATAEEPPSAQALYQEARQARERGDHAAYASRLAATVELIPAGDPGRPGVLYELARAQALAGQPEASLATLVRLWEEKAEGPLAAYAETDPVFAPVHALPGFRALLGRMDELAVTVEPVRGTVRRIEGAGCTLAASVGPDGILLIDTGYAPAAGKVREALRRIAPGAAVRFLVNTHAHEDHSAGNALFASEALILAHAEARRELAAPRDMLDQTLPPRPPAGLPALTVDRPVTLHLNGEEIRLIPLPSHTRGDLAVIFRGSGVVHLGDAFFPNDGQPFLFPGEDPEAFLRDLAVLEAELPNLPEGALVLSGHAPPVSVDALRARARHTRAALEWVRAQIAAGRSREEIERLAPAAGLPSPLPGPWLRYFHEKLTAARP